MQKDIRLARRTAADLHIPLPSATVAVQILTEARDLGYGHRDLAALHDVLAQSASSGAGRRAMRDHPRLAALVDDAGPAAPAPLTDRVARAARARWPWADSGHGRLPVLLVGLTVVTGLVDAVSYLALGHVFVANMTGNVVFLGFALAGAPGLSAPASLAALGAFGLGALAGGRIAVRYGEQRARARCSP